MFPAFNVRRDGTVSAFVVDLPEADPGMAHVAHLLHNYLLLHEVVRPVRHAARVAEVPPHSRPGCGRRCRAVHRLVPALGGVVLALPRRRRRLVVALLGGQEVN